MSERQTQAIKQLRSQVGDVIKAHHDDLFLLRWLRARNFDVGKAETMLRKSLAWREDHKIDDILSWEPPAVLLDYYPGGYQGCTDKQGRPLRICLPSKGDYKGILLSCRREDVMRYEALQLEKGRLLMEDMSRKNDTRISQFTVIFDMSELGMKHLTGPTVSLYSDMMTMTEANYPETLGAVYIVNAPRMFPIAYSLVRAFISEETKNKIHIFGGNWKSKLQEHIDADQLPAFLGGTRTDPDGDQMCKSTICIGGTVPRHLYLRESLDTDKEDFTQVSIDPGKMHKIPCHIDQPGAVIRWKFMTKKHDLQFGLYLAEDKDTLALSSMKPLLTVEKVHSCNVPQEGAYDCQKIGTYVVVFDNTFSWMNGKSLMYKLEILKPIASAVGSSNRISYTNNDEVGGAEVQEVEATRM